MATSIERLEAERIQLQTELQDNSLSDEDMDARITRADELGREISAHNERVAKANEMRARLSAAPEGMTPPSVAPADESPVAGRAVTSEEVMAQITGDRQFQRFIQSGGHGTASIRLNREQTRALFGSPQTRAALGSVGVVQPMPTPGILPPLLRPLRVADLFDRQKTSAGSLTYVQDQTTNPEGAAAEVAEGAVKPTTSKSLVVVSQAWSKIAHILPVVMEAVEDNDQLEGYLRGSMTYGLDYRVDTQLLNGNGTAPNLKGVLNVTGLGVEAPGGAEQRILTIRRAKTVAQLANVPAEELSVVLNPTDWELVELATASGSGEFLSMSASYAGVGPRLWGMPVVSSNAIAAGTALVGAFKTATIWDRMEATVTISDSNQDYFEKNILTLRAELRLGLAVPLPKAFVKTTFNGTN